MRSLSIWPIFLSSSICFGITITDLQSCTVALQFGLHSSVLDLPSASAFRCPSVGHVPGQVDERNEVEARKEEQVQQENQDRRTKDEERADPNDHCKRLPPPLQRDQQRSEIYAQDFHFDASCIKRPYRSTLW